MWPPPDFAPFWRLRPFVLFLSWRPSARRARSRSSQRYDLSPAVGGLDELENHGSHVIFLAPLEFSSCVRHWIHHRSTARTSLLDTRREIEEEEEVGLRCKMSPRWWLWTTMKVCISIPLSRIDYSSSRYCSYGLVFQGLRNRSRHHKI
jgi:hypothetical protein